VLEAGSGKLEAGCWVLGVGIGKLEAGGFEAENYYKYLCLTYNAI